MSVNEIYDKMYATHGTGLGALGWSSYMAQQERFQIIHNVITASDTGVDGSMLDVGCGFGDMSTYYSNYLGVDRKIEFVQEAQRRYPDKQFACVDILERNTQLEGQKFDYVLSSGLLTFQEHPWELIKSMWDLTSDTLVFNWWRGEPRNVLMALGMCDCNLWQMIADYIPGDITVVMRRGRKE